MIKRTLFTSIISVCAFAAIAQNPADRDTTFKMHVPIALGEFANASAYKKIAIQADGKVIYVSANYHLAAPSLYSGIMRLNTDGGYDYSFNEGGVGAAGIVSAVKIQSDGKILIGGNFPTYNGVSSPGIARLHPDGSLDTGFNPGTGAGGIYQPVVRSIDLQQDGKIIIAGSFTTYNGTTTFGISRLNTDGTLDNSFDPGTGPNHIIEVVKILPSGKVLVGGRFSSFNGVNNRGITLLNSDGTIDVAFNSQLTASDNGPVRDIVVQPDGKILVSGAFNTQPPIPSGTYRGIIRLLPNGDVDDTFNIGEGAKINTGGGQGYSVALYPDGKILLTGWFNSFNNVSRSGVVRLNANGDVDPAFNSDPGLNGNSAFDVAINPANGKIYLTTTSDQYQGGSLFNNHTQFSGHHMHVIRLHGDGGGTVSTLDENTETNNIKIYPNPAQEQFFVHGLQQGSWIAIYDLNGRLMFNEIMSDMQATVNTSAFKNGIYFIQIRNKESIHNQKLIINN